MAVVAGSFIHEFKRESSCPKSRIRTPRVDFGENFNYHVATIYHPVTEAAFDVGDGNITGPSARQTVHMSCRGVGLPSS